MTHIISLWKMEHERKRKIEDKKNMGDTTSIDDPFASRYTAALSNLQRCVIAPRYGLTE